MARIHGESGALTDLLQVVGDQNIKTLPSVVEFTKNFKSERTKIIADARVNVENQMAEARARHVQILDIISRSESKLTTANSIAKFMLHIRIFFAKRKERNLKTTIEAVDANIEQLSQDYARQSLSRLDRIRAVLEENKFSIIGAMGEEKTIDELAKLSDEYVVINDFRKHFQRPIYNRRDDDRIYSAQADHIVIGPTGLFIIETKYWSKHSIEKEDLFSPVQQVKRIGFALFVYLNDAINHGSLRGIENNWGKKKISPKQIVVSMNPIPRTDFQFVKVLTISNLNKYITSGSREFSPAEVDEISTFLAERNQTPRHAQPHLRKCTG